MIYEDKRRKRALVLEEGFDEEDKATHTFWTEKKVQYNLGLERWTIETDMEADGTIKFINYLEDWEQECISAKIQTSSSS